MRRFHARLGLGIALASLAMVLATAAPGEVVGGGVEDRAADDEGAPYEGGEVHPGVSMEGSSDITPDLPEVALLAETHGVDPQLAVELAKWMMDAERAVVEVRSQYPDTFAGSEFVHNSGNIKLDLWVTGEGSKELALLNSMLDSPSFAVTAVQRAPISEIELAVSVEETARTDPGLLGFDAASDVHGTLDFKTGTFVPESPEKLATLEQDSHDACTHGTGGGLEGGRHLFFSKNVESHFDTSDGCTPTQSFCTSGFTGRLDGYQGIVTAGHCMDEFPVGYQNVTLMYANAKELYVSLRRYLEDCCSDDDVGFAREVYASADPRGRIYLGPSFGWRNITSLLPAPAPLNATRCIKSASGNDIGTPPNHDLGYKCGKVNASNYCHFGWCRYTKVFNAAWNDFPRGGSSGGPWFNVGAAAGIHKDSLTDEGIYYRLDRAKIAFPNLSIYCGGTSEYLCTWP